MYYKVESTKDKVQFNIDNEIEMHIYYKECSSDIIETQISINHPDFNSNFFHILYVVNTDEIITYYFSYRRYNNNPYLTGCECIGRLNNKYIYTDRRSEFRLREKQFLYKHIDDIKAITNEIMPEILLY